MATLIKQIKEFEENLSLPGDKSISHRALLLAAISEGLVVIENLLESADVLNTKKALEDLGVKIEKKEGKYLVYGRGLRGLKEPKNILDVGNSGTSFRLLAGILAGQNFTSFLTGDASLLERPMKRITEPLEMMGVKILGRKNNSLGPLALRGEKIKKLEYKTEVASAQVKSCLLLASLYAEGFSQITEPEYSRNHTEIMLKEFKADIKTEGKTIIIRGLRKLENPKIKIAGDISTAAFFVSLTLLTKGASLLLKDVLLNPTRTGFLEVVKMMGADLKILRKIRSSGELVGDILVKSSPLRAVRIKGELIPRLIDELPLLAVLALFAEGRTVVEDARELRYKESDRIRTIVDEFKKIGAEIEEREDGFIIEGKKDLQKALLKTYSDHRLIMAFTILGLRMQEDLLLDDRTNVEVSYPEFFKTIERLGGEISDVD